MANNNASVNPAIITLLFILIDKADYLEDLHINKLKACVIAFPYM